LSSIEQALASINKVHELKGWFPSPTKAPAVRTVMQGIRRTLGHGKRQKEPATAEILRAALKDLGVTDLHKIQLRGHPDSRT